MEPRELANKHLGEYKERNGEIIAKICPFCKPRKKDNLYKFYMNRETGAYICYRKNKCGAEGSFYDLLEHFGEVDFSYERSGTVSNYEKQEVTTKDPTSDIKDYLELRRISENTWKSHNVKEKDGNVAFEYYQNGELVLVKYRTASVDKRYWQEGGGKPVLWEIDETTTDKPLIITEGEFDKLALHEAGIDNVVSVPFGSNNLEWIKHCWEKLKEFEEVIVWADNDEAGLEMREKIVTRLGKYRCKTVNTDRKDANVMLYKDGKEAVREAVKNAEKIPIKRALQLDEIENFDPTEIPKVKSSIPLVNKFIGGFMEGMLTIWSGTNGSGKSTFLNQQMIESVEQDKPCCVVSGELPHGMLRYWLELQAAGPKKVKSKLDPARDEISYYLPKQMKKKIRRWAKDKLFVYDSFDSLKPNDILEVFKGLARRYGVKHFLVDNLMVINYEASRSEKYNKQAQFIKKMKNFAMDFDTHVHVVAHPRKPKGVITKEDIAGLYEITNYADNVGAMHRITEKNKKHFSEKEQEADNILEIFKSRLYGRQDISMRLKFNEPSKRFFQYGDNKGRNKSYSWEEL